MTMNGDSLITNFAFGGSGQGNSSTFQPGWPPAAMQSSSPDNIMFPGLNVVAGGNRPEQASPAKVASNPADWDRSVANVSRSYSVGRAQILQPDEMPQSDAAIHLPLPAAVWLFGAVLMAWLGFCKHRHHAAHEK